MTTADPSPVRSPRIRRAVPLALATMLALVVFVDEARALDPDNVVVSLSTVASGLTRPVAMGSSNDGTGRLFIVEKPGKVRVFAPSSGLRSTPYLDIRSRVNDNGNEQGLLGIAFHPSYKTNGYFFVTYTNGNGDLRVSRFRASTPSSNSVSASSERIIITIEHPDQYTNHNGGALAFRDGYLFISTGDGGGSGGPGGYAQSRDSLLGKILRLNINSSCPGKNYCSPSTNPFYGTDIPGRGEIWHLGLRNPWKFSFDLSNGTQWIADVGQSAREEVNYSGATAKGRNYGWDCYEGTLNTVSTYGGSYCSGRTFTRPVHQYSRSSGRCAIIGGYVYRGSTYRTVIGGMYFFADYCTGEVFALNRRSDGSWDSAMVRNHTGYITSFGQSSGGELYVLDDGGRMYRLRARNK